MSTIWLFLVCLGIAHSCFVVHFVYFDKIPLKYSLQMSQKSLFPYTVHFNQPLNLPNIQTFKTKLSMGEITDIKKVETIYRYGGLYLHNDQWIDYPCIKNILCPLTGLYFLDLPQWNTSIPLSFIYSSSPHNSTLLKSLQGLNQPVNVPAHMQQYRADMDFVKVPEKCGKHRYDKSQVEDKSDQDSYLSAIDDRTIEAKYSQNQKNAVPKFVELWETRTVVYPKGFDVRVITKLEEDFNHVEMLDTVSVLVRVICYSTNQTTRKLLQQFFQKYQRLPPNLQQIHANPTAPNQTSLRLSNWQRTLKIANQYFYSLFLCLLLLILMGGLLCHRYTICCKNNNYEAHQYGEEHLEEQEQYGHANQHKQKDEKTEKIGDGDGIASDMASSCNLNKAIEVQAVEDEDDLGEEYFLPRNNTDDNLHQYL